MLQPAHADKKKRMSPRWVLRTSTARCARRCFDTILKGARRGCPRGIRVHDKKKGCRTTTCLLPDQTAQQCFRDDKNRGLYFKPNKKELAAVTELKTHLATELGLTGLDAARLVLKFDLMISTKGQTPQNYHMDSKDPIAGIMVYLNDAQATMYGTYVGKRWHGLKGAQREKYLEDAWAAVDKRTHVPRGGHSVAAGTVILSNTGHIHKEPPRPTATARRTIFVSVIGGRATASHEVLYSYNRRDICFPRTTNDAQT